MGVSGIKEAWDKKGRRGASRINAESHFFVEVESGECIAR